jgi:hypothetical protein
MRMVENLEVLKKVGEYYVECNFNNKDIIVQTKKLLDLAGITQGEVLLR